MNNRVQLDILRVTGPNDYWVSPVTFGDSDAILNEVQQWIQERDLGRRLSHSIWRFKDRDSYTTFLLAWR